MNDEKNNPHTGQPWPDDPSGAPAAPRPAAEAAPAAPGSTPESSAPSQQELAIRSALETVMDPEIGLSVIDLGLIREVHLSPGKTLVRMMLTTPFCPYAPQLMAEVKQAAMSAAVKVISGVIGGVAGGQILTNVLSDPNVAGALSGVLGDAAGGVVGGGVLTAIVGAVMGAMNKR